MDNNNDIIFRKDGKDLTAEDISKLGITIYKPEKKGEVKTFKEFATALISLMENYESSLSEDDEIMDVKSLALNTPDDNDDLIDQLNKIYTPILITQELENSVSEQIIEECSNANVLLERNIIKFDTDTRFAQLVSVCALLIARKKNSEEYKVFKESAKTKKQMKLRIQKMEHAAATDLAKKYLNKISNDSTVSSLRKSAEELINVN